MSSKVCPACGNCVCAKCMVGGKCGKCGRPVLPGDHP